MLFLTSKKQKIYKTFTTLTQTHNDFNCEKCLPQVNDVLHRLIKLKLYLEQERNSVSIVLYIYEGICGEQNKKYTILT